MFGDYLPSPSWYSLLHYLADACAAYDGTLCSYTGQHSGRGLERLLLAHLPRTTEHPTSAMTNEQVRRRMNRIEDRRRKTKTKTNVRNVEVYYFWGGRCKTTTMGHTRTSLAGNGIGLRTSSQSTNGNSQSIFLI